MKTSRKKEENVLIPQKKKAGVVVATKTKSTRIKKVSNPEKELISLQESKTATKKRVVKTKETKADTEEIFIPSTASLRLLEKIEIYKLWYRDSFSTYVANTAKVSGYIFVVLGAMFASLLMIAGKHDIQLAAVVCTEDLCTDINDSNLAPGSPQVTFLNSLPLELKSDTDIVVKVEHSTNHRVYLKSLTTNEKIELNPIENLPNNEFRYLIDVDSVSNGEFAMQAEVKSFNKTFNFAGPVFKAVSDTEDVESVVEAEEVNEDVEIALNITTTSTSSINNEEQDSATATTTGTSTKSALSLKDLSIEAVTSSKYSPIAITINSTVNSEYLKINTSEINPSKVEVYARTKELSSQPIYLGQATKVQNEWIFNISALELPNIDLLLNAKIITDKSTYQTEGIYYTYPRTDSEFKGTDLDNSILNQKIQLSAKDSDLNLYSRNKYLDYFIGSSTVFSNSIDDEALVANEAISDIADEIIGDNKEVINLILTKYSSAISAGNTHVIKLVEEQIVAQIKKLSNDYAVSSEQPQIASIIETVLSLRYQVLKEKIKEQEEEFNKITSNLISKDTDLDGISDYDEIASYSSNPQSVDTDHDGVIDSIEIITGNNPYTSDVTDFSNRGKSQIEHDVEGLVTIKSIEPVITKNSPESESVYAVVIGTAIPNSYVTVHSYTNNFSGIIKASDTGNFAYTLETDLEDGEYKIRAVVSDNAGNYVSGSKIYEFTKKSSDFIATAIVSQQTDFESENNNDQMIYSTIIVAMAVVAFGFILLMLSQNVRNKKAKIA